MRQQQLSPSGRQAVDDIGRRHGFGAEAVASMLESLIDGHGGMAQFSHPEFGGSGQWMHGGMTMVSDMFNQPLKGRVDALCNELSALLASQPEPMDAGGSFQSQRQGGAGRQGRAIHDDNAGWQVQSAGELEAPPASANTAAPANTGSASLFEAAAPQRAGAADWWPAELQRPDSTGAQNDMRYAYFAAAHRLAIERRGQVTVYDTCDHRIGGFSQQQSDSASLRFTSQHGTADVAALPVVESAEPDREPQAGPAGAEPVSGPVSSSVSDPQPQPRAGHDELLATIEKLARLHGDGVLTEQEFSAKKAELLARL